MELYRQLKQFGKVKLNEALAKHTTFRIGGRANFFVISDSVAKLIDLLKLLQTEGVNYIVLGGGSNVLVSDDDFEGVVIKIKNQKLEIKDNVIEVEAGAMTAAIAQEAIKHNLDGFVWGVGVPGTIGGAVRGNAGAMGGQMKDVVDRVHILRDGETVELANAECGFGYRDSIFKHNSDLILKVYLKLEKKNNPELSKKALAGLTYRSQTQPKEHSSGCIFKNAELRMSRRKVGIPYRQASGQNVELKGNQIPKEFVEKGFIPAGWLVAAAGMKGERAGQAQVSETHGNFIVNNGGATAAEVRALIERVKEKVYDKFGIELEEEIQLINF